MDELPRKISNTLTICVQRDPDLLKLCLLGDFYSLIDLSGSAAQVAARIVRCLYSDYGKAGRFELLGLLKNIHEQYYILDPEYAQGVQQLGRELLSRLEEDTQEKRDSSVVRGDPVEGRYENSLVVKARLLGQLLSGEKDMDIVGAIKEASSNSRDMDKFRTKSRFIVVGDIIPDNFSAHASPNSTAVCLTRALRRLVEDMGVKKPIDVLLLPGQRGGSKNFAQEVSLIMTISNQGEPWYVEGEDLFLDSVPFEAVTTTRLFGWKIPVGVISCGGCDGMRLGDGLTLGELYAETLRRGHPWIPLLGSGITSDGGEKDFSEKCLTEVLPESMSPIHCALAQYMIDELYEQRMSADALYRCLRCLHFYRLTPEKKERVRSGEGQLRRWLRALLRGS